MENSTTFLVFCPACEATLRVGDHLRGKLAGCPKCGHRFRIQQRPGPAEEEDAVAVAAPRPARAEAGRKQVLHPDDDEDWEEDRPRRRRRSEPRRSGGSGALALWIGGGVAALLVVAGLAILVVILTRPAQPAGPPVAGGNVAEPGRIRESGFSYLPPANWTVGPFPGLKFKVVTGQPIHNFAPNMNFVTEHSILSLHQYKEANLAALRQMFQGFQLLEDRPFTTNQGLPGFKIVQTNQQNGRQLRQVQYFFGKGNEKIVITTTAPAECGPQFDPLFEGSVRTFRFE